MTQTDRSRIRWCRKSSQNAGNWSMSPLEILVLEGRTHRLGAGKLLVHRPTLCRLESDTDERGRPRKLCVARKSKSFARTRISSCWNCKGAPPDDNGKGCSQPTEEPTYLFHEFATANHHGWNAIGSIVIVIYRRRSFFQKPRDNKFEFPCTFLP